MGEILFRYESVHPTTWVYLSGLLTVGLFFKFNRLWSLRNFDLLLLIALSPGLLLVLGGRFADDGALAEAQAAGALAAATDGSSPSLQTPSTAEETGAAGAELATDGSSDAADADVRRTDPLGPPAPLTEAEEEFIGPWIELVGYRLLFVVGALLLLRLLIDPAMVRRPLLEPNLNAGGMTFIGICLFCFLMANVLTGPASSSGLIGAEQAEKLAQRKAIQVETEPSDALIDKATNEDSVNSLAEVGPGYPLLFLLPRISTSRLLPAVDDPDLETSRSYRIRAATTRIVAICAHLAIVLGMVFIGYLHFDNIRTGVAAATLYLMAPYTSQMTGRVDHCLPAALLVWTVAAYRRPLTAGVLLGFASGAIYYPAFLLPLWISFYWRRGVRRFLAGVATAVVVMAIALAFTSPSVAAYLDQLEQMFGWRFPVLESSNGFWHVEAFHPAYRRPVLAAFVVMSLGMSFWPAQKNLGTLLSCSAAVMLGTQFWHAHGGGIFMAWYLPLMLLTFFRPNLEDRVAVAVLGAGWLERKETPRRQAAKKNNPDGASTGPFVPAATFTPGPSKQTLA